MATSSLGLGRKQYILNGVTYTNSVPQVSQ